VRRLGIEVVSGSIEVHWQEEDGVVAVLLPVSLGLYQQHFLRQPVWRIGLLGVSVPQIVLVERHGSVLRVGADGAGCHELLYPGPVRFMEQLGAHYQVVVEELCGVFSVGTYATNHRRQVDHYVHRCAVS